MARKPKARVPTLSPRPQGSQQSLTPRRWRLKLVIGGAVLAIALGVGGLVRWLPQRDVSPSLARDSRKTLYARDGRGRGRDQRI